MAKDYQNRFISFAELQGFFKSEDKKTSNQILKTDIKITDKIKPREVVTELQQKLPVEEVKVVIHKELKSVHHIMHRFCNYLKSKSCYETISVNKIFELDNKLVNKSALPFHLDENDLKIEKRQIDIMNLAKVYNGQSDGMIGKASYQDIGLNTPIRIYYTKTIHQVTILLIDLYHLFATKKLDNYDKYKKCSYAMENLKNIR